MRRVFFLVFSIAVAASWAAAAEADFIGAQACGACHREPFEAQARSAHSRSLSPASRHPLAGRFAGLQARLDGSFDYSIQPEAGSLVFHVRRGETARRQLIDWAFGAGQQAVTFVSRLDEDSYAELRASFYPEAGLSLTPGHQNHTPASANAALGVRYKTFSPRSEILSCFGCHSTGTPSLGDAFEIRPAELGVRCESCHGAGREHQDLIAKGEVEKARRAIGNPGRLAASAQMDFCGRCHRPPASGGDAIDWNDPWNVRHQPVYLTQSACFQKTDGGLSCMACHDPHGPMRRNDAAFYNRKCADCHSAQNHSPAEVCRSEPGCASCHMPAVRPQPQLVFHNHWIGVYEAGEALRPRR